MMFSYQNQQGMIHNVHEEACDSVRNDSLRVIR